MYEDKCDSNTYIAYLRKKGVKIGQNTTIFEPMNTCIDDTRPWFVTIGENVKITRGVTILTHGYDWSVLNGMYGEIFGSSGKINIGDNVFIGMHSTILKGVSVGSNVIIGANSLVNKNIPDNCIVAGNPAKVICSLAEYREKRKNIQVKEAKELAVAYMESVGKVPPKEVFREFLWLFENETNEDGSLVEKSYEDILHINNNFEMTKRAYAERKTIYKSYDDFIDDCFKQN